MPSLAIQAKTLSGLSSGTLAQHMLAITAGTGTGPGATVFVDRLTLCSESSSMTMVRKASGSSAIIQLAEKSARKRIDVLIVPDQIYLVRRTTTESVAFGQKNRVLRSGDRFVGVTG